MSQRRERAVPVPGGYSGNARACVQPHFAGAEVGVDRGGRGLAVTYAGRRMSSGSPKKPWHGCVVAGFCLWACLCVIALPSATAQQGAPDTAHGATKLRVFLDCDL